MKTTPMSKLALFILLFASAIAVHGQIPDDPDGDGVPDPEDLCPLENASGFDRNGDGCIDDASGARHIEYWGQEDAVVTYLINDQGAPGVPGDGDLTAIQNAFDAWNDIAGTEISAEFGGTTAQEVANGLDGINLVTFADETYAFGFTTLAVGLSTSFETPTEVDGRLYRPGEIFDTDMIFNPRFQFGTSPGPGVHDIQSVATHEAGHMLGISHAAVRTSTMYFVLPTGTNARSLASDDVAVFRKAYGSADVVTNSSRLEGTVLNGLTNDPVPGAIVYAIEEVSGDSTASDFTMPDGSFTFVGLPDGNYFVSIHPLDGTSPIDFMVAGNINQLLVDTAETNFLAESYDDEESNTDDAADRTAVSVSDGNTTSITIITNIDAVPPFVVSASPNDGTSNAAVDGAYVIRFSERINRDTIAAAFSFRDASDAGLGGNIAVLKDDSVIVFTPGSPLEYSSAYTLRLDTDLQDLAGNALEADFVLNVTTELEPPIDITSLAPNKGVIGNTIVINGHGFAPAATVTFNGVAATVVRNSPNALIAVVPDAATTGDVVVTNPGPEVSDGVVFTVLTASEVARGYESGTLNLPTKPNAIALTPDGAHAYIAAQGGVQKVGIAPAGGDYLTVLVIGETGEFVDLDVAPDRRRVYALNRDAKTIVEISSDPDDAVYNNIIASRPLGATPRGITVDPFGYRAYVSTDEAEIQVWDIRLRLADDSPNPTYQQQVNVLESPDGISLSGDLAIPPAGDKLLALGGSGEVFFYDLATNLLTDRVTVGPNPSRLTIDPQGQRAYVGDENGNLAVVSMPGAAPPFFVQDIVTGGTLRGLDATPAGLYIYATDRVVDNLKIVDLDETHSTFRSVVETSPLLVNPVDVSVGGDGINAYSVLQGDVAASPRMVITTIGSGPTIHSMLPTAALPGAKVVLSVSDAEEGSGTIQVDFNGAVVFPDRAVAGVVIATVPAGATSGPVRLIYTPQYDPLVPQVSNPLQFKLLGPVEPYRMRQSGELDFNKPGVSTCDYITPALAMSPFGDFLYTGCGGTNEVNVFDIRPQSASYHQLIGAFAAASAVGDIVRDIAITADGKVAFVAGGVQDDADPRRVQTFYADPNDPRFLSRGPAVPGPDEIPLMVRTSPNNRHVILCSDFEPSPIVMILDASGVSNGVAPTFVDSSSVGAEVTDIVFHPSGLVAYVATASNFVRVIDMDPASANFGLIVNTVAMGLNEVWSLAVSPDGQTLYAYGYFYTDFYPYFVEQFTLANPLFPTGATSCQIKNDATPPPWRDAMRLSPRGDFGIYTWADIGFLPFDVACPPETFPTPVFVQSSLLEFAFTPDGRQIYAANQLSTEIRAYDFLAAQSIAIFSGDEQSGVAGEVLPAPVRVRVTSAAPSVFDLQGVPVTFSVEPGNGSIETVDGPMTTVTVATDVDGFAQVEWRLDPTLGAQNLVAMSSGLAGSPLLFHALAVEDPNTLPLSLVDVLPLDGSSNIGPTTTLLATFSRAIDTSTINSFSFYLRVAPAGPALPGTFGYTDANRKVSITPSSALDLATLYEIVLTDAIAASGGGGALTNPTVSDFTTVAAQPLSLSSVWPPSAIKGVTLTLAGRGFDPVFSANTVLFNAVAATPIDGTRDVLRVVVPNDATTGTIRVTTGAETSSAVPFTVLIPSTSTVDDVVGTINTATGTKSVVLTGDGALCYAVGADGDIVIPVDVEGGTTYPSIPVGDQPVAIVMHPQSTFAYVANFNSSSVSVIDVDPASPGFNKVVETITVGTNPIDLAMAPDGDRLAVANLGSSDVSIVDTDEGSVAFNDVVGTVGTAGGTKSVVISADGTLYVGTETAVLIMEAETGAAYEVVGNVPTTSGTKSMTVSPDGGLLFALTNDGTLLIVDIEEGSASENEVVGTVGTTTGTKSVVISADGTLLYLLQEDSDEVIIMSLEIIPGAGVINPDGAAPVFTVVTRELRRLQTGADPSDLAIDPSGSGRLVVANTGDKTITIYGRGFEAVQAEFKIVPGIIIPKLHGLFVLGVLQLPEPYSVHDVDISSVRVFDTVHVLDGLFYIGDVNHDGVEDLSMLFCRDEFLAAMPENGEYVDVVAKGLVENEEFEGDDTIRVLRPTIEKPAENERVAGGHPYTLKWTTPLQILPCDKVKIEWRHDGDDLDHIDCDFDHHDDDPIEYSVAEDLDQTDLLTEKAEQDDDDWILIANHVENDGDYVWNVPAGMYPHARLRITLLWFGIKVGSSEVPFMIDMPVPVRLKSFEAAIEDGAAVLRWETSLEAGMEGYRVVRSERELGRYDEVTKEMIASSGSSSGGSYEYRDETVSANRTYWYKLREVTQDGLGVEYGPYSVTYRLTSRLDQNVPNPFNPSTVIGYAIARDDQVMLTIYDVGGRKVRTLVNERQRADVYRVTWDGTTDAGARAASGVYFYKLVAGKFTQTKKMVLLK